jgi:hypothetical protein
MTQTDAVVGTLLISYFMHRPSQISFNLPASRDRRHRVASHGHRLPLVGPEQIKEGKKRGKNADAITYADGDASLIRLVWNPLSDALSPIPYSYSYPCSCHHPPEICPNVNDCWGLNDESNDLARGKKKRLILYPCSLFCYFAATARVVPEETT